MILAQTKSPSHAPAAEVIPGEPHEPKVAVEEILSYDCARNVAGVVNSSHQIGPVFAIGSLVFTSLEAKDASHLLLVNGGGGIYAINLENLGVNRIHFQIPTSGRSVPQSFYLTYMHGASFRSRYFEFSEGRAPLGKDDLDYSLVPARRADYLQAHLNYAIHETAEVTLNAITDGRLRRDQLTLRPVEGCEYIERQAPALARNLKHNLNMLDVIVSGPAAHSGSDRRPASGR